MSLDFQENLRQCISAGFTGVWLTSSEHHEVLRKVIGMADAREGWGVYSWDLSDGLCAWTGPSRTALAAANPSAKDGGQKQKIPAYQMLGTVAGFAKTACNLSQRNATIVFLPNFHRILGASDAATVIQGLLDVLHTAKQQRLFFLVSSFSSNIPPELAKSFITLDYPLPDRETIRGILLGLVQTGETPPSEEAQERILSAAAGLTASECESAFSLAWVRYGEFRPEAVWELKAQALKATSALSLYQGQASMDELGGLTNLKQFCRRVLTHRPDAIAKPKGCLLLGPGGTGKSAYAKALGAEIGRPTIVLDVGALYGKYVGESEANTKTCLQRIDAMAPCVLFIDEVDRAMAGGGGGNAAAGGGEVSTRLMGSIMTWLNDRTSDVFVIASSNDVTRLPPEFTRAGRFDAIFFVDLPTEASKIRIWDIHMRRFNIPPQENGLPVPLPDDKDWSGAEIESCCRLANLMNCSLIDAAVNVVPIAATAAESLEALRKWANDRCLSAEYPGRYTDKRTPDQKPETPKPSPKKTRVN